VPRPLQPSPQCSNHPSQKTLPENATKERERDGVRVRQDSHLNTAIRSNGVVSTPQSDQMVPHDAPSAGEETSLC
jgi:hypothetical protein